MKDKVSNQTKTSLIELELVNQEVADGKAILLAKREGIGYIEHVAVGDVTGDGKKEVIVGTDVGVVMAFSPFGETLWRFEGSEPVRALTTADLNDDGKDEVIVTSKGMMALNSDGTLDWESSGDTVRNIALVDIGNGKREIVAAMDKIKVFDANGLVTSELEIPEERSVPRKVAAFDVDSSGEYKIGIATRWALYLFHKNGEMIWRRTAAECGFERFGWRNINIATADLKGDGKAQILVASYDAIIAFGSQGEVLWRISERSGRIAIGDVSGDGKQEIAIISARGSIYLVDSDGRELWRCSAAGGALSIAMADVNNDGFLEIIAGGFRDNPFVSIINSKGVLEQQYDVGSGVRSLICDDIDGDGDVEIIAGSADLHVFSRTGKKWGYRSGGRFQVALADIDGDGAAEIITGADCVTAYKGNGEALWRCDTGPVQRLIAGKIGSAQSEEIMIGSYTPGLIYVDSQGRIKWEIKRRGVLHLAIADINDDGQNEIIVGSSALHVFDALGNELWNFRASRGLDDQVSFYSPCSVTGNIDGYNGDEIITSFVPGGLWVLDGEGEVVWNYFRPLSKEQQEVDPKGRKYETIRIISIATADVDKDGKDEVIAASEDKLYFFDDDGNLLWEVEPKRITEKTTGIYKESRRRLVSCADMNDDGNVEIISAVGGLSVYNTKGEELWGVASSGEINDIAVCDINGDGQKEILVASDELEIFSNDGERIFNYKAGVGCLESVSVGDVDGDGILEIVVGGCGVYVLKLTTN